MSQTDASTIEHTGTDTSNLLGKPHKVILYNDDSHDQMTVSIQIIKAIHCDINRATAIMMEAHTTGRAIVYTGGLERCEHVEAILSEIKLSTKIEPA